MSYYFLTASLPALSMDAMPEWSIDEFREQCRMHLRTPHLEAVEGLLDGGGSSTHSFVSDWRDRDTQLRNAIARNRASRRNQDLSPFVHSHDGFDLHTEDEVDAAFNRSTPVEREHAIDRLRWVLISDLEGTDEFSIRTIMGYALKLRIAHRWAAMDEEAGQTKADQLINQELTNE